MLADQLILAMSSFPHRREMGEESQSSENAVLWHFRNFWCRWIYSIQRRMT